jgi:hypothetical protein
MSQLLLQIRVIFFKVAEFAEDCGTRAAGLVLGQPSADG